MEDVLKNRVLVVLAVLTTVFFFSTLSSCNGLMRQKAGREKEMAARLQLEEKMNKFSQERSALGERIKAKENEAEEANAALEEVKKTLVQEQLENASLKEELQKASKK
ncbi:MAG: hypothetical protein PHO34_03280 [Candidatus Omnitrophica bacterium]|nr:hypothetical protein [Candidatus Omnitrophota bacterium]MDD5042139.1 hypothetical protein [Candidatus Omnitrophota bacterium]MDD5500168.1 hypothetical protein [Candidatus Omnitrophota bacterium]